MFAKTPCVCANEPYVSTKRAGNVLQCVAVCCSVLPCVAVCCIVLPCIAVCCSVLQCVAVCCRVLPCVAVCCSVLQCVAVSRRSCTMSLIMSASGFPCIEGDFPSPVHFWEEERKQAESDRRITGFLFCCLLESSSARHAAPNSVLFDEFPSTPRPSWQQPPNLKKPAPMTPRSFDPSVAYTEPGKL